MSDLVKTKSDINAAMSNIGSRMSHYLTVCTVIVMATAFMPWSASAIAAPTALSPTAQSDSLKTKPESVAGNVTSDDIIREAKKYIGHPYRRGSSSPRGFDCSGFTSYVFRQFGIKLGRSSRDQIHDGTAVKKNDLKKGDLVFFTGSRHTHTIGHVGIVTEVMSDGDFRFIHAARKGIVIDSFKSSAYYTKRYVGARRIVEK